MGRTTDALRRGLDEVKLQVRAFGARIAVRLRLAEEDDFDVDISRDQKRR